MKILFICGNIEPSKDGVGDYTRRLCGEVISGGHQAEIISLFDSHVSSFKNEIQVTDKIEVDVYRIPLNNSFDSRKKMIQSVLDNGSFDWISLQFVPYSFNKKGIPNKLTKLLASLKGSFKWHFMFHELWLGLETQSSKKNKFIGMIQLSIIKKLVDKIKPEVIHTQSQVHLHYLNKNRIPTRILPLFGNIPVVISEHIHKNMDEFVLLFFGTIHKGAMTSLKNFISDLEKLKNEKAFKIVLIGRNGSALIEFIDILKECKIEYDVLGELNEYQISEKLLLADYGVSTTPYIISEKSGTVAAMKEHNLNVLCVSKDWDMADDVKIEIDKVSQYDNKEIKFKQPTTYNFGLNEICNQFLKSLNFK